MKLAARLKGFTDQELVEGGEAAQRHARDELRREQRLRVALNSGWPCFAREEFIPAHFGLLEHRETGDFYTVSCGEQAGDRYDTADAYYVDRADNPVFLQQPQSGPKTRAELEQHRARHEQDRASAPRP